MQRNVVTVIMYHYVRDLLYSRYPGIKGLDITKFERQMNFVKTNYNVIRMEDFIDALQNKFKLPKNAAILTFDDGYIDHFTQVLPILLNNNFQGSFYIPARILNEVKVLDVNKIHFILEKCSDVGLLIKDIFFFLDKFRDDYNLESNEYYYNKLAISNRFDSSNIIFVKRILQSELSENLREVIVNFLFDKYMDVSEHIFFKELYLSYDQIRMMFKCGMHIGAHGYNHIWFEKSDNKVQEFEIVKSVSFLDDLGVHPDYRTLAFPYGSYNEITIELLKKYNFKCAFTTKPADIRMFIDNNFAFPRFDTNDIPLN